MKCYEPGAIRSEELLAYLDGEQMRPAISLHLRCCQACMFQIELYQRIEAKLKGVLYRWDCPSHQIFGEYLLGLLSQERTTEIKKHLSECVLCAAEVATLAPLVTGDVELAAAVDGLRNS